MSQQQGIK